MEVYNCKRTPLVLIPLTSLSFVKLPPPHFKTDEILSESDFAHLFNQHFAASSDQTGVTAN